MAKTVIAAVEGGGTTFVVAIAEFDSNDGVPKVLVREEIPTAEDPNETLDACAAALRRRAPDIRALAVATFGPLGINERHRETYGRILATSPKAAWRNVDVLTPLAGACAPGIPVAIETDVNAPALAEYDLVLARNSSQTSLAYVTVGTGVGVGLVVNGKAVHGRMHPEGGHVCVQPLEGDHFGGYSWGTGTCPYKGKNTVEGLTSSVALTERLNHNLKVKYKRNFLRSLDDDHEVWDHAANALANLCVTLMLTVSIEAIVLGGGLMQRKVLLPKIRARTLEILNGYLGDDVPVDDIIRTSAYGNDAGLMGAIMLAKRAHEQVSIPIAIVAPVTKPAVDEQTMVAAPAKPQDREEPPAVPTSSEEPPKSTLALRPPRPFIESLAWSVVTGVVAGLVLSIALGDKKATARRRAS